MKTKNRMAVGSNLPQSKLHETDVVTIKQMLDVGWMHKNIAKIFNVKREAITKINRGICWQHVMKEN